MEASETSERTIRCRQVYLEILLWLDPSVLRDVVWDFQAEDRDPGDRAVSVCGRFEARRINDENDWEIRGAGS